MGVYRVEVLMGDDGMGVLLGLGVDSMGCWCYS